MAAGQPPRAAAAAGQRFTRGNYGRALPAHSPGSIQRGWQACQNRLRRRTIAAEGGYRDSQRYRISRAEGSPTGARVAVGNTMGIQRSAEGEILCGGVLSDDSRSTGAGDLSFRERSGARACAGVGGTVAVKIVATCSTRLRRGKTRLVHAAGVLQSHSAL